MGNAFLRVSVLLQKNYNNINTMKDSTNEKKTYEPPQLTVVSFKVEQGFATSGMSSLFVHSDEEDEFEQDVNTTFGRTGYGSATNENGNQQSWF